MKSDFQSSQGFEQVLDPWLDWKSLFMKLHKSIFELEIWQRVKYFFRRSPIFDIISASEPTRIMTLLLRTSIHLNKSLILD